MPLLRSGLCRRKPAVKRLNINKENFSQVSRFIAQKASDEGRDMNRIKHFARRTTVYLFLGLRITPKHWRRTVRRLNSHIVDRTNQYRDKRGSHNVTTARNRLHRLFDSHRVVSVCIAGGYLLLAANPE